jgi:hypothetical protein
VCYSTCPEEAVGTTDMPECNCMNYMPDEVFDHYSSTDATGTNSMGMSVEDFKEMMSEMNTDDFMKDDGPITVEEECAKIFEETTTEGGTSTNNQLLSFDDFF